MTMSAAAIRDLKNKLRALESELGRDRNSLWATKSFRADFVIWSRQPGEPVELLTRSNDHLRAYNSARRILLNRERSTENPE